MISLEDFLDKPSGKAERSTTLDMTKGLESKNDNYYKICEECDYVISEVNRLDTGDMHIGLEDFINTIPNYPNAKFYVVHRGDFDTSKYDDSLFPDDGDVVEI